MKNIKGITLITLVITIIILLILAGVTIAVLTAENGILGKSQTASEKTNKNTATEIINLKITNAQIESYSTTQTMPTLQFLADAFYEDNEIEYVYNESQKIALKEKIQVTGEYIYTKLSEYPYEFQIDGNLKLASIDGVKVADSNSTKIEELTKKLTSLQENYQALKEDYENYKNKSNISNPNSITTDSLLMKSFNDRVAVGNVNLSSFTNSFKNSFDECFSFNQSTGELTCKKDGWYTFQLSIKVDSIYGKGGADGSVELIINNQHIQNVEYLVGDNSTICCDSDSFSVFLKNGDVIQILKSIAEKPVYLYEARVQLFKQ